MSFHANCIELYGSLNGLDSRNQTVIATFSLEMVFAMFGSDYKTLIMKVLDNIDELSAFSCHLLEFYGVSHTQVITKSFCRD